MTSQTLELMIEESPTRHGVKPVPHALLNREQRGLLARLDAYDAPWLEEKLLKEGTFSSPQEYQEAFTEFKKYVALYGLNHKPLKMSSKKVDSVWHQFILFTPQYHQFCDEMLGGYMHHTPTTSFTPSLEGSGNLFNRSYQEIFGAIPKIWDSSKGIFGDRSSENCLGGGCMCGCNP